jgi:spore coat polysaccharide biosynthesis predicted glycosyltransferase SpsG
MFYENVKLIINPNVYFSEINYNNQNSNMLGGIDFVILRETFRNVSKYKISNKKKLNILVTIGGSDYRNIMPLIIETLLINSFHNIVAISPDKAVNGFLDDRLTILKMQNENEIYEQMLNCDIAISACGQTLHELASIGVPTIGICIDSDQILNQQFYFKSKFLPNLISWNDLNLKEKILDGLQLLHNIDKRVQINNNSLRTINRNGVYNIINEIKML